MNKEVRLVLMNGVWIDVDQMLKLLTRCVNAAYDTKAMNTKEDLMMEDFREDMISRFGDEEVDYENCD